MLEQQRVIDKQRARERTQAFYDDLLDESHNKVKPEVLHRWFISTVMNPAETQFKSLRNRILKSKNKGDKIEIQDVIKLNPQVFLKQEPDDSTEKNKHRLVEALDSQTHHQFNLNPNKRIYISQDILMQLLHGNTDGESAAKREAESKSKTNKFLEFNIQKRKLTKKGRKLVKRLSLKNVSLGDGDGL